MSPFLISLIKPHFLINPSKFLKWFLRGSATNNFKFILIFIFFKILIILPIIKNSKKNIVIGIDANKVKYNSLRKIKFNALADLQRRWIVLLLISPFQPLAFTKLAFGKQIFFPYIDTIFWGYFHEFFLSFKYYYVVLIPTRYKSVPPQI